ncbi:amino acid adenylation domain-containing protein [Moorena producens JHB]|uniref:Amino acid adenylation domain-containing protein n=1 Tax=Moorena producens (strain JHB) TaxID=1454205 RepID=A0A9Q9SU71_MOOP1|nr:amino acid adenylation domain-containing protein [Moorena producens]WAN69720.1 amino acid adenylation domain-containing protein [Moorena producens JHB]
MKTIEALLSDLRRKNINLWLDDDNLCYKAPPNTLTPSLLKELKERKAEIVAFLDNAKTATGCHLSPILPAPRDQDLILSFAQERLWFLNQLEGKSATYNITSAWLLIGNLSLRSLEQALNEILRRHEILRTTFARENGVPIQVIASTMPTPLSLIDLQQLPEAEREAQVQNLVKQEAQKPFDLERGPLLRVSLLQLGSQSHVLMLTMHHIISDGWSMGVLWRELSLLYQAFSDGEHSPLAPLPIQYADFALWQREWFKGNLLETQLNYWKQQLKGVPPLLELPYDRPRPPIETFRGGRESFKLSAELTHKLHNLSQKSGCTLFMTLLAAWSSLLYRYSGQSDILVGTPIANRNRREIEPLMGFFVNTLVMRTQFPENISFAEVLKRVRQTAIEAYGHQDLPFEKLVQELKLQRSLSHNPLFQVMFALQNATMVSPEFPGLTFTKLEMEGVVAKFDLFLSMNETSVGLQGEWGYNSDLFDRATIRRWIGHFQVLLEGIIANPQQPVYQLPLLTETERHQLLVEWNNTATDYPKYKCIHQLFEEQVELTPDAVAVVFEDKHLTYRQLNNRANQLAHYLRSLGVVPEVLVGICVERSLEMVVGLLGILKAGGAYVPIDPDYPRERIAYMLKDSGISVLLTQKKLVARLPEHQGQIICLDPELEVVTQQSDLNPNSTASGDNLAYVIYTSGSTGKPKGVAMKHFALSNLINWQRSNTTVANRAKTLQFAPVSFDVSFQEMFSTWCAGGTLVLIQEELRRDPMALLDLLAEKQVERLFLPFVALQQLAESAQSQGLISLNLREVITAGEQLQITPAIASFFSQLKDCTFHNHYGPSETHVVTAFTLTGSTKNWSALPPIGTPIANTQIYILDNHLQPVPIGIPGEINIGGVGLARGYLNRPEITEQKFIPNPFSKEPGSGLYKTGDLARYLPDGNIEFLGRIDNQVKIRGFRIELSEIEATLAEHPEVQEVVVIVRETQPGDKRLVAYVVSPGENIEILTTNLRGFLKQKLPQYMIPNAFVVLDALPLTPNGKVDRRGLPAPDTCRESGAETFVAPRDSLELQLAQIWSQVLGIQPIGVTDNFFELGGHSLLAVRLVAEIEKVTQTKLPLAALFQFTTIEEIASILKEGEVADHANPNLSPELLPLDTDQLRALLTIVAGREGARPRPDSLMVAIRPTGVKPPLFYCANGVREISTLAHYLGEEQPVYLLESGYTFFIQKHKQTEANIKAIAASHVRDILEVYPTGPILLTGYSLGKLVAYEVAKQLQERGKKVAFLAILDTTGSGQMYRYYLQKIQPDIIRIEIQLFRGLWLRFARKLGSFLWELKDHLTAQKSMSSLEGNQGEYLMQGYSGKITLFVTRVTRDHRHHIKIRRWLFPLMGWEEHVVDLIRVPGDHNSMVSEPDHVRVLADKLKTCIDQALAAEGDSD